MKIKKKPTMALQLPGALALAAAGAATQANAATVQISFANNSVSSSTGLNNLVGDLTGDGTADVYGEHGVGYASLHAVLFDWGPIADARFRPASGFYARAGGYANTRTPSASVQGLMQIGFRDSRINGGVLTVGLLDMTAVAGAGNYAVQVNRLIFNNSSTTAPTGLTSASTGIQEWSAVPEPSSLGLLALGAGGLLARRRRSTAA